MSSEGGYKVPMKSKLGRLPSGRRATSMPSLMRYGTAGTTIIVLLIALVVTAAGNPTSMNFMFEVLIWTVIAASWNVLAGIGYISLATSAWYGLGGYVTAVLMVHFGINFYVAALTSAALILVFAIGTAVPMLRIRSHYFIMGTFFLAVVIGEAVGQIQGLGINGQAGMYLPVPPGGATLDRYRYLLLVAGVLLVVTAVLVATTRSGRLRYAVRAIGEDEDAAMMLGVPNVGLKLLLYGVTAALIGLAGVLQAYSTGFISPSSSFDLSVTVDAVIIGVLGGIGSLSGAVLGAFVVEYVSYSLGPSLADVADVIYGVIVLAVVIALPRGLVPSFGSVLRRTFAWLSDGSAATLPEAAKSPNVAISGARSGGTSTGGRATAALGPEVGSTVGASSGSSDGAPNAATLSVVGVCAGYGPVPVLHDVTLTVADGEKVGILGPNGAGKTTLVRVLSGLVKPTEGSVWWKAQRIDGLPAYEITRLGVSVVPEGRQIYPGLSVEENLLMGVAGVSRRRVSEELAKVYELVPLLAERRRQLAGTLSGGQQQLCAICRAVMGNPSLLIVDEPSLGLAPRVVVEVVEVLSQLVERVAATLLVIDQDLGVLETLARRGYFVDGGRIAAEGNLEGLRNEDAVKKIYFGEQSPASEVPLDTHGVAGQAPRAARPGRSLVNEEPKRSSGGLW